jgi:peptidyl-prolyl cis-trans isomerase B (cyclophilin B)
MPGYASQKTNTLAIVSLVSAFLCGLAGVITGIIALRQIESSGEKGRGLAIAGICVGAASMLLGVALSFG